MATEIAARNSGVFICRTPSGQADVTYFLHYHMYTPVSTPSAAWFTHLEPEPHPLHNRWFEVAEAVTACVASCDLYAATLPTHKTRVILPGVDTGFVPRRLKVGTACQWAHGNEYRKGKDLLERLRDEDWIDLRLTNGSERDMLGWYQDLDVYLVSSRYEGAPLPAIEAALCGLRIVAPRIGVLPIIEQYHPVEWYESGDYKSLLQALHNVDFERESPLSQIFSWDIFAREHMRLFEELKTAH